jgi:DNA invertase Pin-like site-specific DNA recombinase
MQSYIIKKIIYGDHMQKGAIYIRVSTHEQLEFSPDAQKSAIYKYAEKNNIAIDVQHIFIDEGFSGRKAEKRPQFMKMINYAKKKPRPFDFILVHKFDRFSRNREDSVVYKSLLKKQYGIKVISITEQIEDDKFSIILESMLEAMAEYYSLNLADEVRKGMTEKAKRGGFQGSPPYGYKVELKGKVPTIVENEAEVIRIIYDKFVNESMSYRQIATYLNDLSYRTKKGHLFESRAIKYILRNPFYYGEVRWNCRNNNKENNKEDWIIAKGNHIPIIDKKLWESAKSRINKLEKLTRVNTKLNTDYRHWLSGILKCPFCGGTMTYTKVNHKYEYFRCNKYLKGSCTKSNYIKVKTIEDALMKKINEDMNIIELTISNKKNNSKSELEYLYKKQAIIVNKYKLARDAYINQIDTLEEYRQNKKLIQQQEHQLYILIKSAQENITNDKLYNQQSEITEIMSLIGYNKRLAIMSFIKKIIVNSYDKTIVIEYYINK